MCKGKLEIAIFVVVTHTAASAVVVGAGYLFCNYFSKLY